jgi:DNA-binding transcriptional LysR family regulator
VDLDGIAVFVKVVQAGSFSQAAKLLNMPNSDGQRQSCGFGKKARCDPPAADDTKVAPDGSRRRLLSPLYDSLEELHAAENELAIERGETKGVLRLTAPVELGRSALPPVLDVLMKRHPAIKIDLIITNRLVDLVVENIDVAVRAGPLKDSGLIARRFVLGQFGLWASPSYLKNNSVPRNPDELKEHDCFTVRAVHREKASTHERPRTRADCARRPDHCR